MDSPSSPNSKATDVFVGGSGVYAPKCGRVVCPTVRPCLAAFVDCPWVAYIDWGHHEADLGFKYNMLMSQLLHVPI